MGLIGGGLRLPMTPLSEKFFDTIRDALHEAGIAVPPAAGLRVVDEFAFGLVTPLSAYNNFVFQLVLSFCKGFKSRSNSFAKFDGVSQFM